MKYLPKFLVLMLIFLISSQLFSQEFILKNSSRITSQENISNMGVVEGYVTDDVYQTNNPIARTCVVIGTSSALTDGAGFYSISLNPGTYNAEFSAVRYQDSTVNNIVVTSGNVATLNMELSEITYPPEWVTATTDSSETVCYVNWEQAVIPFEIFYDDGSPEDYLVWMNPGNINAVKFGPFGDLTTVQGGMLNVGDGSFPSGGNFLGETFEMAVFDDNGSNGLPGTKLDSVIVTVDNYGWINFDSLSAEITEGYFYLGMIQTESWQNAAPIAIDYTQPMFYKSYNYQVSTGLWTTSAYQDFIIRAVVSVSNSDKLFGSEKNKDTTIDKSVCSFTLARFSDFDPSGSILSGTETVLENGLICLSYTDTAYGGLEAGYYGYGVKAIYSNGDDSEYTPSNIVCNNMEIAVTINVTTTTGENAEGSEITLTAYEYPYEIYTAILDTSETITFDTVHMGLYNVEVNKIGYYIYSEDYNFISDSSISIYISEKCYQPYDVYVDPLTSIATWHAARITQIREKFNDATFPPEGWQTSTASCGWFATTDGSSTNWTIPAWDSQYVCANDDACGSGANGSEDYLITPKLDLRESDDFSLKFDSYYDGGNGQLAYVEYSLDAGVTWIELLQISPNSSWQSLEISLAAFSGVNGESEIWFAFHADDAGGWATGWAIDNVEVSVGSDSDWPPSGYYLYLDDIYLGEVGGTSYTLQDLTWGQTYTFCVCSSCELSFDECYTFTSEYLYPPTNLYGETSNDTVKLVWFPPCALGKSGIDENQKITENKDGDRCIIPDNFLGYNLYIDSLFVDYYEYNGEDSVIWFDYNMEPGTYSYTVTAEYDVTVYGGTGTQESMQEGPEIIQVSFGNSIPFIEDWSNSSYATQQWETTSVNWIFDYSIGNPAPSAEFHCYPMLSNYEGGLISYPILGSEIINEEIYLEYDYMLEDRNETGLEFMTVKIWENGIWHEVANYANEGDIEWTTENIDISEFAQGNDFKIGFFANGANSVNFKSWFIDNIYSDCEAPSNLTGEFEEFFNYTEILLNWNLGEPPIEEWIQYDDGANASAIGLSGGGAFEVSAYWPASSMAQYVGANLTEVEVYIADPTTTAMVKIYGAGTPTEPGDLLAEQSFDGIEQSWITVELDNPVAITGEDIWIGYYGDTPAPPEYFAGTDAGPAVAGFGDMISMDGITFESMSIAYGLDYNWNIHGFLTNAFGETIAIEPIDATHVNYTDGIPEVSEKNYKQSIAPYKHRDFVSFSIYRDFNNNGYELLVEGLTDYTYIDVVYSINFIIYYYITAVYDYCISDPSNEIVVIGYPHGIDETNSNNLIQIFPNPSVNHVYINSKEDINKITVFDDLGKLVFEKNVVDDNNIKINTSTFDAGVYFIKIFTDDGVVVKKIAVTK